MSRLNIERQKELEPERMEYAKQQLQSIGFKIFEESNTYIKLTNKGEVITFFPFTGWATGKSIKDGRGLKNLLNQLK